MNPQRASLRDLLFVSKSQNLLQLCLLRWRQRHGKLDVISNDKVAALAGLLRDWHTQSGVGIRAAGLRRAGLVNVEVLALNRRHLPLPARQGFLEIQVDRVNDVVALTGKKRMGFLCTTC